MQADEELRLAGRQGPHGVLIPDFLKKRLSHEIMSNYDIPGILRCSHAPGTDHLGVRELRTAAEVDTVLGRQLGQPGDQQGPTVMVIVNSVCGCAAGKARPGVALALQPPDQARTSWPQSLPAPTSRPPSARGAISPDTHRRRRRLRSCAMASCCGCSSGGISRIRRPR